MKLKKHVLRRISAVLLITLLSVPTQAVFAKETEVTTQTEANEEGSDNDSSDNDCERQVIRVAFPTQEGMSFFGHSGKVTGYNYDYLEKISEYTGWEMEYVPYGSADGNEAVGNAISDLEEGNVDLLGPLLKNEYTEAMFEFPEKSYGTVYTTLNALSSGSLRENNLYNIELLRVGLWQQAETRNEEVLNFLKSENLPYEIIYFETSEEQFAPRPYYFASTKGNTELINKLDETIELIDQVDPNLQDSLYNNYFRVANDAFQLNSEQKEKLENMGTLRILCAENAAPYAFKLNGEPAGLFVSMLNDFSESTGLSVEYTFCKNRENVVKY